ncbi:MAG: hypothetical protein PVH61_15850 [Candidatus Aminicenantes bacterium]|jgi:hypothetical protein
MKKNILFIAVAVLLTVSYGFGEVTFSPSYTDADTALIKDTFKAVLPNLDFARADRIAQNIWAYTGESLILDEQSDEEGAQLYKTIDNSASLKIDRLTGDIFYRKYNKFEGSAPGLPSRGNAKAIAKKHLMALGLYKKEMGKPVVNTLNEAVYDGQTTQTFEKMRVVTFTRKLGGIPVLGASRAAVMLGANGDLEGLVVRWMDVKSEKVKGKVAKSQLKGHIKSKLNARKIESDVLIKKANLIIFDDGKGNMEPMLHLEGELVTQEGNFFSDWMVPVINK